MKHLTSLLLKAVILLVFLQACKDDKNKIKPAITSLTESVYASVTVRPDSLYQVFSVVAGIIDSTMVEEGDLVKKGQPLIHLVSDQSVLMKENAALNLQLARENSTVLRELENELETVRLKMRNDSANYFRQKRLWEQGIGSKIEYENRKLSYELSQNNYQALKRKYERTRNELKTNTERAENTYLSNLTTLRDHTIESKINGKIYSILKEQGELVSSQQPIATIGKADKFIIEMLVDEVDIVRVKEGQEVLLTLDAYGDRVFEARISQIYPSKNERTQTFKVEATFSSPPETLYPGLSGEANIIVQRKENTMTIPIDYLVNDHQVQTEEGLIEVETGIRNMNTVEILDGLDTNTYIAKPAP